MKDENVPILVTEFVYQKMRHKLCDLFNWYSSSSRTGKALVPDDHEVSARQPNNHI